MERSGFAEVREQKGDGNPPPRRAEGRPEGRRLQVGGQQDVARVTIAR